MTHTEESLLALADAYTKRRLLVSAGDRPIDVDSYRDALRLAIREVMAERDEWEEAYLNQRQIIDDELRPRAEKAEWARDSLVGDLQKAEAEVKRMRATLVGIRDGLSIGSHYPEIKALLDVIDVAIEQERP